MHTDDPATPIGVARNGPLSPWDTRAIDYSHLRLMHVSVTALGARPDRAQAAANDIVNYLEGGVTGDRARSGSAATEPQLGQQSSPGSYYSDSAEQAGRWRGAGTTKLGDTVDVETFRRVLLGQDPTSGRKLVTASGSSARAKHHPKGLPPGDPAELVTLHVAADAIGVDISYLRRLARETATSRSAVDPPPGPDLPPPAPPRDAYLDAEKVGRQWMATRAEIERFIDARSQPQVVMAYDITFSAPKSLSIVWAAGDEPTRRLCEEAFEAGVARGVAYLEQHALFVGRQGARRPASDMIAASYRHSTNRELEPQLHEHVVIANMGRDTGGFVRALDSRSIFANATTAGYLAEAEMQHHCNQLGIAWTETHRGIANVVGVPDEAIRAMSTRREQILNLTSELGTDSAHARQKAALVTRASKETSVDLTALRKQWIDRLESHGFGSDQLAVAINSDPTRPWTDSDSQRLDRHLAGAKGVTEQQAIFDRRDVIQAIVDLAGGRLSGDEVEHHADRWLHTDAVIPLTNHERAALGLDPNAVTYTTPTMVRLETAIADGHENGHDTGAALVPGHLIDEAIATWQTTTGHRLGRDQEAMVRSICGSGDRFQAVVGAAGSGKTAALEVAARAWESAGFQVIGAAVNGTAAEVLQRSTGVPSRTVAGLVTRLDTSDRPMLTNKTVVLVDEASTLGNRQHARLVHHVNHAGASMRTVGDAAQHGAVEAGGMWAHLVQQHADRTPRLTENRRQSTDAMADIRLANLDYRSGRIAEAITRLETNQRIVTASTSGELLDQLAADWYVDRKTNPEASSRMIAEHHRERRALNTRAQQLLRSDGTLTGPGVQIGDATFHIGDEVIARAPNRNLHPANDRTAYVRNGTTGTITGIQGAPGAETLIVDFDNRGEIAVPNNWLTTELRPGVTGGLSPAYAVTSHAAQGDTYRTGRIIATDTASTEAVYVGLTRGSHDARIYTVRNEPHTIDTDPRLPRIDDPRTEIEALTDQLSKQKPTELASVANPDIERVLALSRLSLPELVESSDPLARHAQSIVESRIAHTARTNPDPAVIERLGPRPVDHELAQTWNHGVEAVAIYRTRWNENPLRDRSSTAVSDQISDHEATTIKTRAAQVSSLTEQPTTDLAARRAELVSAVRRLPVPNERMLLADLEQARANLTSAHTRIDVAVTPTDRADAERTATQAQSRLQLAKGRTSDGHAAHQSIADGVQQVENIDEALAPRISSAVESPSSYIIETLGDRPDRHPERWDAAAKAIETYRHATLGIEPSQGALPDNPGIGPRPTNPLATEAWTSAAAAIHSGHDRGLNISR